MSIDILTVLVRWSPVPLSDILVSQIFPAVVQCTLHTDDSSTMQVNLSDFFVSIYCMSEENLLSSVIGSDSSPEMFEI